MSKRVLILSAAVGAGHVRAAQAIELALAQTHPDAVVRNVDVLQLTNRSFRRMYARGYFDAIAAAPHLVGYLYDRLDRPLRRVGRAADRARYALQRLNFLALEELLTANRWDLAINTHFLPAEVIGALLRAGRIEFPQVTATTDFDVHRLWHNEPCEHYFTATQEGKANLAAWGVPAHRISATGIPVHPAFAEAKDQWACKRGLDLVDDRPVILQLAGGFGIGPIEELHRRILEVSLPLQVVAVTGRNFAARCALEKVRCPPRHRRTVLGFTDRIDELMAAADLIVSKAGGLSTSEALCRGSAMVIVDPIPGQETRNSDYLLENGAAVKVNNLASVSYKLSALLNDTDRLRAMRAAATRLARPRAAFDIAQRAMSILQPFERRMPVSLAQGRMTRFRLTSLMRRG